MPSLRIVADLGNTRLKWGTLGPEGRVSRVVALAADEPAEWVRAWSIEGNSEWWVASVNPPAAEALARFLGETRGVLGVNWVRSAAEVDVPHVLSSPATTGADRALAVSAAIAERPEGRAGLVVLCGTAVTVERVSAAGVWEGGAIAAGMGLTARALHMLTAQLPLVVPKQAPRAWGVETLSAMEAGIYWGVVGAVRELIARQSEELGGRPWVVWTGGDGERLAAEVDPGGRVVPDLVLRGLAREVEGGR